MFKPLERSMYGFCRMNITLIIALCMYTQLHTPIQVLSIAVRKGGVAQRSKTTEAAGCQTEWGKLCGQFVH